MQSLSVDVTYHVKRRQDCVVRTCHVSRLHLLLLQTLLIGSLTHFAEIPPDCLGAIIVDVEQRAGVCDSDKLILGHEINKYGSLLLADLLIGPFLRDSSTVIHINSIMIYFIITESRTE